MDFQYRHNSTGNMLATGGKPYRFELHYDSHSYRPNRPINARLLQYQQYPASAPTTAESSPLSFKAERSLPLRQEVKEYRFGGDLQAHEIPSPKFDQQIFSPRAANTRHSFLERSISMPTFPQLQREGRPQLPPSRKNSLVSNCTHSSREGSVSSMMSETTDQACCHRHHHRRGSVAIKFEEKKVVDAPEDVIMADDDGDEPVMFKEGVFAQQ